MPKLHPTDEKVMFLVSDDVRPEPGKKLTVLGLLLGDIKVGHQRNRQPTLSSLSMLFVFKDGEGDFSGKVVLRDPAGVEVFSKEDTLSKLPNQPMVAGIRLQPFLPKDGLYLASVELDGHRYERSFRVELVDTPAEA